MTGSKLFHTFPMVERLAVMDMLRSKTGEVVGNVVVVKDGIGVSLNVYVEDFEEQVNQDQEPTSEEIEATKKEWRERHNMY